MEFVICKICEGPFKDQKEYDVHSLRHVKLEDGETIKIFKCEKCDEVFESQQQLNDHLWRHLGIFSCRDCDESFTSLTDLEEHVKTCHLGVETKKFDCDIIPEGSSSNMNLVGPSTASSLTQTTHNVFECKRFQKQSHLRDHELLQQVPDAFKCQECSKTFSRRRYFKTHQELHKNPDLYKCNHCPKTFTRPSTLKGHLLSYFKGQKSSGVQILQENSK